MHEAYLLRRQKPRRHGEALLRTSQMAPVGLEPTHRFARLRILSPLRLPIPPQGPWAHSRYLRSHMGSQIARDLVPRIALLFMMAAERIAHGAQNLVAVFGVAATIKAAE